MHLPTCFAAVMLTFAPPFVQRRTWRHAEVLVIGAILAPGRRTVTSILRIAGLARERRFVNYHRVLSRAAWCPLTGARLLLGLLIAAFAPRGPVVLALDDTIERRRGRNLPRSRALVGRPLRVSERPALDEPDAARPHPMGRAGLGAAVPDRARAVRARLTAAGTPT